MTTVDNTITYSKADLKIHAGELRFRNLFGDISLERLTYVSGIEVSDENGIPVQWARVYIDGRLIGTTDETGTIPVRWTGEPPMVRVLYQGKESLRRLAPGNVKMIVYTE